MPWFDATNIDPNAGAGAPVGRYPVAIRGSRVAASQNNSQSGRLIFDCEILDGVNKGQRFDYGLNLWNENKQSAEIAARQLSAICHVTGVYVLNGKPEGVELFGKPFIVVADHQAAPNDKYTEVKQVQDIQGNPPQRGQAPATSQASAQAQQPHSPGPGRPVAGEAPPWSGGSNSNQQAAHQPPTDAKPAWAQQPAGGGDRPSWNT